ncbi:MAG: UDP-N-acetylmuramoyl-L-alanine--D-glutamate ligase [Desulfovibrionaceae bacterium]|nr:UDP-N-acetylmuramoyl-L-alanine--D-glutamate ligase [Desulfovibrionaceae bacterium]
MTVETIQAKKIGAGALAVVVGAGRSGRAAARLLLREQVRVRLLEQNPANIPADFLQEMRDAQVEIRTGAHSAADFADAQFVIPSPGMPVASLMPLLPTHNAPEVLAEMELAWRFLQGEPALAITGTSGKTTTVSLAAAMLQAQGLRVFLGGNIGTPLSEYVLSGSRADVLVLEVSSFQLQACTTFHPHVGVILNISPNHLDYHKDMAEYVDAKFRIFQAHNAQDFAVLGEDVRQWVQGHRVPSPITWLPASSQRFTQKQLFGAHNALNMEAAWLAVQPFGVTLENAARAVADFASLPNRLERVDEKRGVLFVNDSKATTIAALEVALTAFDRPVLLLCGGKFKGGDVAALNGLVQKHVKAVFGFGAAQEHFEPVWKDIVPVTWDDTLEAAVRRAALHADAGDVVLLSPATASFDLYANYVARGNDFKRIVGLL